MPDNQRGSGGNPFEQGRSHHGHHRPGSTNGTNGTNGARLHGMQTRSVPFDQLEEPIDLVAVQADDELINALSAGMSVSAPGLGGYDADDRVAAIMAAWKADVDSRPIPELVDVDTAVATVLAARTPPRRARHLAPLAAAAAFIVLSIGAVSVGSYSAGPDDALWGVSKVLYTARADSVEAAARAEQRIDKAKEALVSGQPILAAQELAQAQSELAAVRPEEGQDELVEVQDFLRAKAAETPPGESADLGAPLATEPSRRVPPGATSRPTRPSEGTTSDTEDPSGTSATRQPGRPGSPGSSESGSSTSDEDMRKRNAPAAPGSSADASTTTTPTRKPGGGGEGGPNPTTSTTPSATPEGGPDPTTAPGQSMGTPTGSTGATAPGSGATSTPS